MSFLPLWIRFPVADRIMAWNLIADLLDSGFEIERTLPVAAEVLAGQGKGQQAHVIRSLEAGVDDGSFTTRIQQVAPGSEAIVFGGYASADARQIFRSAARVAGIRQRIKRTVWQQVSMPVLLSVVLYFLLWAAGKWMIPAFETLQPREYWPVLASTVGTITTIVFEHTSIVLGLIATLGGGLYMLCGHWKGLGRAAADRMPPFSLVRFVAGTGFLFTVLESVKTGIDLDHRLFARLAQGASPYERSRIAAITHRMEQGHGFGTAMELTGHGFPSPDLIPIIVALEGRPGWDHRLSAYLDRWIEGTEEAVRSAMGGLNKIMMGVVTGVIAMVLIAMFQLVSQVAETGF